MSRLGKVLEEMLPKNKKNLIAVSSSKFVSSHGSSIHEIIWQPYVLALGGNVVLIGILKFLWDIVSSWFQRLGGRVSDQIGRKTTLILASLLVIASIWLYMKAETFSATFLNVEIPQFILLFPAITLLALAFSFSDPAAESIVAESVGLFEKGKGYAFYFMIIFLPALYISVIAGYLVGTLGFHLVWKSILFLEVAALIIALFFVKETLVGRIRSELSSIFSPLSKWIRMPKRLRLFTVASTFDRLGWNLWVGIMFGMLIKTYELTPLHLGILGAILFGTISFVQIPIGRMIDKVGEKLFLILSELCIFLAIISLMGSRSFLQFMFSYFLVGLAGAAWLPAFGTYITRSTTAIERGKVFGDINAIRGVIASPAPIVGSIMFYLIGFDAPLTAGLFMITAALLLLLGVKRKSHKRKPRFRWHSIF